MDRMSFSTWMNEGGSVFAGEDVAAQTASSTVNTKAASSTNIKTTTPQVHNNDIGVQDTGVTSVTRWDMIDKPTIHNPFTHEVEGEVKIADENIDIFTPSVKLTDIFSTNMNPFLGESSTLPQHNRVNEGIFFPFGKENTNKLTDFDSNSVEKAKKVYDNLSKKLPNCNVALYQGKLTINHLVRPPAQGGYVEVTTKPGSNNTELNITVHTNEGSKSDLQALSKSLKEIVSNYDTIQNSVKEFHELVKSV